MKPNPAPREASPGYPTRRQIIRQAGALGLAAFGLAANAQAANNSGSPTPKAPPPPEIAPGGVIAVPAEPPKAEVKIYTVQKGDTLASIAKKQLGDEKLAAEIAKANPKLDAGKPLTVGSELKLPVGVKAPPPAPPLGGKPASIK